MKPLIIVDRDRFRLLVYKWHDKTSRLRRTATYKIATGVVGRATPQGPYVVSGHTKTPDWLAPDWAAPDIAGKILKFEDPRNPFAGGFIALGGHPSTKGDGVGFHGTKFDPLLGTRASHGCIRMAVPDFLDLYDRADIGTVVYVS